MRKLSLFFIVFSFITLELNAQEVVVGAARIDQYLPSLKNKTVGLVVNQTSTIGKTHLVDTLLNLGVNVVEIFAPEHGFRGTADAGELIKNGKDTKTGLSIISLYGDNKKPKPEQIKNLDVIIFDIQDVGVRFYTYISTLQYVMEACSESNKALIILDRPNPNGHYVDGPVLEMQNKSFVGMQAIPVVHGMTIGEYAQFLNGEHCLSNNKQCKITIVPCENYNHNTFYSIPIKPSPNLPNMTAIYLYPSICFFEGTNEVSLGRGTDFPFQLYGSPKFPNTLNFNFTPESKPGAKTPPMQNIKCFGYDLSDISLETLRKEKFTLKYLINAYRLSSDKSTFFNSFFIKLSGKSNLAGQIQKGMNEKEIRNSWKKELDQFKLIRKKYLLYKDFE